MVPAGPLGSPLPSPITNDRPPMTDHGSPHGPWPRACASWGGAWGSACSFSVTPSALPCLSPGPSQVCQGEEAAGRAPPSPSTPAAARGWVCGQIALLSEVSSESCPPAFLGNRSAWGGARGGRSAGTCRVSKEGGKKVTRSNHVGPGGGNRSESLKTAALTRTE